METAESDVSQFGHCIGSALASAMAYWLIPIGVGLLLGVSVGVVLGSMIRLGRGPSGA
jgi:hypothetical protein